MGAYSPAYPGKRDRFFNQIDGFLKSSCGNQGHITLNMNSSRAGIRTWRFTELVDCDATRLVIIFDINRFTALPRNSHRAGLDAVATGRAFVQVNVPGIPAKSDLVIPGHTINFIQIGIGPQSNARVPGCLQHMCMIQVGW